MGDTTHSRWSISAQHENNTLPLQKKIYSSKIINEEKNSKKLLNEKALNKK